MILELKPLTLAEAQGLIEERPETLQVTTYLKKFSKISAEKSESLVQDLKKLNNIKLKETHLVKIADFLPRDAEDVHKIVSDSSLTEAEVGAILDVVKNY